MAIALIVCDRCGEPIHEGRTLLRIESGPIRGRLPEADLCVACAETLAAWMTSASATAGAADSTVRLTR